MSEQQDQQVLDSLDWTPAPQRCVARLPCPVHGADQCPLDAQWYGQVLAGTSAAADVLLCTQHHEIVAGQPTPRGITIEWRPL